MFGYFRYHADLPHPQPAQPVYTQREAGSGWPEHCPPIRAAQSYGWDVVSPFDIRFLRDADGAWSIDEATEVESDIDFVDGTTPHPQVNAWFWEKGQQRPHVITDNVYAEVRHQCKVSTYLYLRTQPGWVLMMTGVPNLKRDFTVMTSLIETDWYFPAHPWHAVIELPRIETSSVTEVTIAAGDPLCRLVPVQRADFEATEMDGGEFGVMFEAGQAWIQEHGKDQQGDDFDLTGAYARQQEAATFRVAPDTDADEGSADASDESDD